MPGSTAAADGVDSTSGTPPGPEALDAAESPEATAMIGVPTATVSPSGTSSADTVPAYGDGSSTSDFAVSISTTMSLT